VRSTPRWKRCRRSRLRAAAGLPALMVDIALHVGEVLYGNVGATDRLDFTVIGPAISEIARIEAAVPSRSAGRS
jgi:class 3 adenylate cyclase